MTFDFYLIDGTLREGEFLEITEITRQQAQDYECITNNGVAPPDQRKVIVTVNCKSTAQNELHVHSDVLIIYVNDLDALLCIHFKFVLCRCFLTLWLDLPFWLK